MEIQALMSLALRVGEARSAEVALSRIVSGLAAQENVALARLWLAAPGDICDACRLRDECPNQTRCLHVMASAGNPVASAEDWSRLNGDFRRMPFSARKVGVIGATGEAILINQDLAASPWIARPEWARREGIVSFARQPLMFRGDILGVLAVFSRVQIQPSEFDWLRIFADNAAIAIATARIRGDHRTPPAPRNRARLFTRRGQGGAGVRRDCWLKHSVAERPRAGRDGGADRRDRTNPWRVRYRYD
jgi:hypothetical protein